jgi:hypothetical protein
MSIMIGPSRVFCTGYCPQYRLRYAVSYIIHTNWFLAWTTFSGFIDGSALAFAAIGECDGSE